MSSLSHVIDHLVGPFGDMMRLRRRINPQGVLLAGAMDSDSVVSCVKGKRLENLWGIRELPDFSSRTAITKSLVHHGSEPIEISSIGHAFRFGHLLESMARLWPLIRRSAHALINPRWRFATNMGANPHTNKVVPHRPRR
jgi:hypothetical protein